MTSKWRFALLLLIAFMPPAMAQDASPPLANGEETPPDRGWISAEYLLWKVRGETVPVLVGTAPVEQVDLSRRLPVGTIQPAFGGDAPISFGPQSGGRLAGGWRIDAEGSFTLEGSLFQLGKASNRASFPGGGTLVVGPVLQDSTINQPVLVMSSIPGLRSGATFAAVEDSLWGAELNCRRRWGGGLFPIPLDILAGFRFLQVDDSIDVSGESMAISGGRLPCG